MQRKETCLHRKRRRKREEEPELRALRHTRRDQLRQVEGDARATVVRKRGDDDDRDQHQQRADGGVEDELDRRIRAPWTAVHAHQQVGGNEHHFPEDVEERQVRRQEDALHAAAQEQHQREVRARAVAVTRDSLRGGDGKHGEQRVENEQEQVQPIHAERPVDARLRQPAIVLDDLVARLPCLELREDRQRSDKIEQRDEQRPPPDGGAWQDRAPRARLVSAAQLLSSTTEAQSSSLYPFTRASAVVGRS